MKKIFVIFILFFAHALLGMKKDNTKLTVYAIPDRANTRLSNNYLNNLYLRGLYEDTSDIIRIDATDTMAQNHCFESLNTVISKNIHSDKTVLHGSLEGAITALNYYSYSQRKLNPDAIIVETPCASQNSTLLYAASKSNNWSMRDSYSFIASMPGAYYWGPYLLKLKYPFYSPSGQQPIKSIAAIPDSIPVIIVHSKKDTRCSYEEAGMLYYRLVENGNDNVYFITKYGNNNNSDLLANNSTNSSANDARDLKAFKAILKKHKLIENDDTQVGNAEEGDLSHYQPDYTNFNIDNIFIDKSYVTLFNKEKNHERLFYFIPTATFLLLCYVMRNHIGRLLSYLKIVG